MTIWAKIAAFVLVLAAAYAWGRHDGGQAGAIRLAQATAAQAERAQGVAEKAAAAEHAARLAQAAQSAMFAAKDAQYQQDLGHAKQKESQLTADLRSARQRLRQSWQCPAGVPGASGGSAGPDAGAVDRAESAGRIVGAAAACDAQVRGLQEILKAERSQGSR